MSEFGLPEAAGPNGKLAALSRGGNATSNGVLAALSPEAFGRLKPFLRERFFRDGHVLWKGGERPDRVYFPVSGMISLVVAAKPGAALEVGSVGRESAVGFDGGADAPTAPASGVVHASGTFVHMPAREFAAASRQSEELHRVELVCREWILAQAQQVAVCNAIHSADARFGRWLARAAEATGSDVVAVTQEVAAEMLGLRRTTVTLIAQNLQAAGIIRYQRGVITILDHTGLRGAACSCSASLGPSRWPSRLVASRADGAGADRPSAEAANRSG
ncbi:MAG: Crp/Fnr family transcriptional regulator [Rhodovulum sp.]|nr:Crp/Fnr family transcriptional regulator [Rhodovulum sp.]